MITTIYSCRACGEISGMEEVLDMGFLPLAGDHNHGPDAVLHPLAIDHCKACGLLQVRKPVQHELIFNDQYSYASSTVPALVEHFREFAESLRFWVTVGSGGQVLDIGCGDGILLDALREVGIKALGVDASPNVVKLATDRGLSAVAMRFTADTAKSLGCKFNVVTCSNAFAHNENLLDFITGVKEVLRPNGQFIVEVHDTEQLYILNQWDFFYHEHIYYWTAASITQFLERNGFTVSLISRTKMHGGALRVHAVLNEKVVKFVPLKPELDWKAFGERALRSAGIIQEIASRARGLVLFGAGGRATTLVHFATIQSYIAYAIDGSPLRAGKCVPGTQIRIFSEEKLRNVYVYRDFILGAWQLEESLLRKIHKLMPVEGGMIIVPLPYVKIL